MAAAGTLPVQFSTQIRHMPGGWVCSIKACLDAGDGSQVRWVVVFETLVLDFEHSLNNKQLAARLLGIVLSGIK